MTTPSLAPCPCGGASYATCCGPFLDGAAAPSAELLMRSRYTAFTRCDDDYLRATWHASTRPIGPLTNREEKLQWLGLEVKSALRLRQRQPQHMPYSAATPVADGIEHDTVEFVARYKLNGRAHRLHEISRFVREDGRWFYVDGSFPT